MKRVLLSRSIHLEPHQETWLRDRADKRTCSFNAELRRILDHLMAVEAAHLEAKRVIS